ncbi:hypothetical protein [Limnohabitans sp. Rim8]|uniref:hypothetical protein n=1 Tax=Limnohabitans sp. Rim8 TaxID=1100718 RepID=UPI0033058369
MQEPLRIVVIISDPALVAEGDAQAQALEDRSRLLRIGLLGVWAAEQFDRIPTEPFDTVFDSPL